MRHVACMLLLSLFFQGCGTSGVEVFADLDPSVASRIDVGSSRLAGRIRVTEVKQTEVGGLLKPAISLKSMVSGTQNLQYKWSWFDASGFDVSSSQQHWSPLIVYGEQSKNIVGLAPNAGVKSFKFHIRDQQ